MFTELPRILSPNLGCPIILPPEELHSSGLDVVMAEEENSSPGQVRLLARPSFPGEGKEFSLELEDREELTERTLPPQFQRVEETCFLISTGNSLVPILPTGYRDISLNCYTAPLEPLRYQR